MRRTLDRILQAGVIWMILVTTAGAAAPKIMKMEPSQGMVDQPIRLMGENLSKTRSVHFLVGFTDRIAKFRVVSNSELEVTVPEIYRPNAEALILLQHDDGVVMTCPVTEILVRENGQRIPHKHGPDAKASLVHVIQGGVLDRTSVATVVEDGGIVSAVDENSPLVMVKNGGLVGAPTHRSSRHGVLFHEPGANVDNGFLDPKQNWKIIPVRNISLAEGIGPFVFQPSPLAEGLNVATMTPEITAVSPVTVSAGDVITVKGKGFSGTTKVYIICGPAHEAGFRIVSDSIIRVESYDGYMSGHSEIAVLNSKGLTLTQSPPPTLPRQPAGMARRLIRFVHVTPGMVVAERDVLELSNCPLFLVENGGIVTSRSGSGVFMVKAGGTVNVELGRIFHEPGASVPVARGVSQSTEVPAIKVSKLHSGLEFIHPVKR